MAGVASAPRVLLVAHDFPPGVGSGSLRALAFARYLPMYGWRPVVLTVSGEWAMNRDDALLSNVPRGLEVVRTRSFEARPAVGAAAGDAPSTVKAAGPLRRQLGHLKRFPDAHVGWLPYAVARARRLTYDVIYSTSGPFTSHVVGLALHASTKKPWVSELRDGWFEWNRAIFPDYPRWRAVLEQRLEGAVIRDAQRVVLVTTRMRDAFRAQYPELPAEHFSEVPNGFDPVQLGAAGNPASMKGFEIVHAGALYYGRSLAAFLAAVRRLCAEDGAFAQAFRLTLFGTFDGAARAEIDAAGLADRVKIAGQVDHAQALAAMRHAALLLLVANTTPGAEATVPGKLYEYLAIGRPILAIAPADSATADVLEQTHAGQLARADDVDHVACALRQAFAAHRAGRGPSADPEAVAAFDRRRLAGVLAHIFDEVRAAHRL